MRLLLWKQALLGFAGAFGAIGLAAFLLPAGQTGQIGAWALVLFFWGAALLAALAQYIGQRQDPVDRYLARHERLAGPRPGSGLPG